MAQEHEAWLRALRALDPEAVESLVRDFSAPLGRYLTGMVRHSAEAEDLVQETFVRFFSGLGTFRWEASPKTFLFKIATNLALNHLDSSPVRREVFPEEMPEPPGRGPSPADLVESEEASSLLRSALGKLPPQQRAVVTLRTWEDLSFREIAAALGIAEGTAKAHYFFALRGLRRILGVAHEP